MKSVLLRGIGVPIVAALFLGFLCLAPERVEAVTYGEPVPNASVTMPEVVSLWTSDGFGGSGRICTATLIEQSVAVTSAHCVQGQSNPLWVMVGADRLGEGRRIGISAAWHHPRYSSRRIANDVAVIHLETPAGVSRVATLSPRTRVNNTTRLLLAGWGINQNGDTLPNLNKIGVKLDTRGAQRNYGRQFNSQTTYGAGRYFKRERVYGGGCNGDSGGPLYAGSAPLLVGVVSYGLVGCDYDAPTVFARIDYHGRMIQQGITAVKAQHQLRQSQLNSSPLTASFSVSRPYSTLWYWDASVSASTVSFGRVEKWCFFLNGQPITTSQISYGSGNMPFYPASDGCFVYSEWFGDTLTSGSVQFNFYLVADGWHSMHAVVSDSVGRTITTSSQSFYVN